MRRAISSSVSGRTVPSRCTCSSIFGYGTVQMYPAAVRSVLVAVLICSPPPSGSAGRSRSSSSAFPVVARLEGEARGALDAAARAALAADRLRRAARARRNRRARSPRTTGTRARASAGRCSRRCSAAIALVAPRRAPRLRARAAPGARSAGGQGSRDRARCSSPLAAPRSSLQSPYLCSAWRSRGSQTADTLFPQGQLSSSLEGSLMSVRRLMAAFAALAAVVGIGASSVLAAQLRRRSPPSRSTALDAQVHALEEEREGRQGDLHRHEQGQPQARLLDRGQEDAAARAQQVRRRSPSRSRRARTPTSAPSRVMRPRA